MPSFLSVGYIIIGHSYGITNTWGDILFHIENVTVKEMYTMQGRQQRGARGTIAPPIF